MVQGQSDCVIGVGEFRRWREAPSSQQAGQRVGRLPSATFQLGNKIGAHRELRLHNVPGTLDPPQIMRQFVPALLPCFY